MLTSCSVDVAFPEGGALDEETLDLLADECLSNEAGEVVALRQGRRWVQTFEPVRLRGPHRSGSVCAKAARTW